LSIEDALGRSFLAVHLDGLSDEVLQRLFVDDVSYFDVDCPSDFGFQAGVEKA
jgi:hypothetical protein